MDYSDTITQIYEVITHLYETGIVRSLRKQNGSPVERQ